jgi:uncharacterized protein YabN with tetrapyrrole methylase and pyrophosphatase domain
MPLLVVALGASEAEALTLGEWDRLLARDRILFEVDGHPLRQRLEEAGIRSGLTDSELPADDEGVALIVEPHSPRIVELARAGAEISVGHIEAPDHLTAAHGAYVARRAASSMGALAAIMARLRGPDGCPWDAKQTHESLQKHLLEEAGEVVEAIEGGQTGAELEDELGDVLLQVAFHAQLAADEDRFDIQGVAEAIIAKLIRRHPHVFGDVSVEDADEVIRNWNAIKAAEKAGADPATALDPPTK